jgi:hypothetical protein
MLRLLQLWLWNVREFVGLETSLDELAVFFFETHNDRARIGLDNLAGDSELLDLHVIAVS